MTSRTHSARWKEVPAPETLFYNSKENGQRLNNKNNNIHSHQQFLIL